MTFAGRVGEAGVATIEPYVIRLERTIHDADGSRLRRELARVPTGRPLVVDMGETRFIGLDPLNALAEVARRVHRGGQVVEVRHASAGIRSLLRATHAEHLFRPRDGHGEP